MKWARKSGKSKAWFFFFFWNDLYEKKLNRFSELHFKKLKKKSYLLKQFSLCMPRRGFQSNLLIRKTIIRNKMAVSTGNALNNISESDLYLDSDFFSGRCVESFKFLWQPSICITLFFRLVKKFPSCSCCQ